MENPCKQCIVFAMCRPKMNTNFLLQEPSITGFAFAIQCPYLTDFVDHADQDGINEMRELYGLYRVYDFPYWRVT